MVVDNRQDHRCLPDLRPLSYCWAALTQPVAAESGVGEIFRLDQGSVLTSMLLNVSVFSKHQTLHVAERTNPSRKGG